MFSPSFSVLLTNELVERFQPRRVLHLKLLGKQCRDGNIGCSFVFISAEMGRDRGKFALFNTTKMFIEPIVLNVRHGYGTSDFTLVDDPRNGALRVGAPWLERCMTSCLVTCQLQYTACHSALYDPETKMCTPGSQVSYDDNEVRPSFSTLFYVQGDCNFNAGFVLFAHNSFVTCLFLSIEKTTFLDAREKCRLKKSHLYTAKSQEKLDLFLHIAINVFRDSTWIGLSDLIQEGTFVWEDGDVLDSAIKVWAQDQPDNSWGVENCAGSNWYINFVALNDLPCSENNSYICEPDGWFY